MSKTTILATALGMIVVAAVAVAVISASLGEFPTGKSTNAADEKKGPPSSPDEKAITAGSGLKIVDLKEGIGKEAKVGSSVKVHYTGWLENGEKFDSSLDSGNPFPLKIGESPVIKGWTEGLQGMKAGGKRKLIIPPDLGYGARGYPPKIPGGATLIFEVEMLEVN